MAQDLGPVLAVVRPFVGGRTLCFGSMPADAFDQATPGRWKVENGVESLADVRDSSVDNVIGVFAFEKCLDPFRVLTEWSRVLVEGGGLILVLRSSPSGERHVFSPQFLVNMAGRVQGLQVEYGKRINDSSWLFVATRNSGARAKIRSTAAPTTTPSSSTPPTRSASTAAPAPTPSRSPVRASRST